MTPAPSRPSVHGKFIYLGEERMLVRGVTYGPFRPDGAGDDYRPDVVMQDFAQMAAHGVNAVRTYTAPPRWLLDAAQAHELHVMVGLAWEQHVAFLDDRSLTRAIRERVQAEVRLCAGHPAVLCFAIGNEIQPAIVRWYGPHRVERFLASLYRTVKAEDPQALVVYANYPYTEHLRLPFTDFDCFNVYLESEARLETYIARLHRRVGNRALVLSEIGLDSQRNGEDKQADVLDWQLRSAVQGGCAGSFVFSWTDEWYRGGLDIDDWSFGLTTRERQPKPALDAVRRAHAADCLARDQPWPRVSVVVCSFNGARTIATCLEGLLQLDYPDVEIIVVDDGSTDSTATIAGSFDVRLVQTPNRGLSAARNTGARAAAGEIIAYIDDDASPDPRWLRYLVAPLLERDHAAVGGPNILTGPTGTLAACVARAPGGPTPVLRTESEADHVPGCNLAVRASCLDAIGGFDHRFRVAGDDVDLCWRIAQRGWTIGFSPSAVVWHQARDSIGGYWRQQRGYGVAEALLEEKWPERYNTVGHLRWSVYESVARWWWALPSMPEWGLVVIGLALVALLSPWWSPLIIALPLLLLAIGSTLVWAGLYTRRAPIAEGALSGPQRLQRHLLTVSLTLLQPLARLDGRLRAGLTPWRRRGWHGLALPWPRTVTMWSDVWQGADERLDRIRRQLATTGAVVVPGGPAQGWDLTVRGGMLGGCRLLTLIEEHGHGHQLARFRLRPYCHAGSLALGLVILTGVVVASLDGATTVLVILATLAVALGVRCVTEVAVAMYAARGAIARSQPGSAVTGRRAPRGMQTLPANLQTSRELMTSETRSGERFDD